MVTATQTNAKGYTDELIRRGNFSEDKRKLAHVTGMVGLNQTEKDKRQGIYRVNWVMLREAAYFKSRCVVAAGSLDISCPVMFASWEKGAAGSSRNGHNERRPSSRREIN